MMLPVWDMRGEIPGKMRRVTSRIVWPWSMKWTKCPAWSNP